MLVVLFNQILLHTFYKKGCYKVSSSLLRMLVYISNNHVPIILFNYQTIPNFRFNWIQWSCSGQMTYASPGELVVPHTASGPYYSGTQKLINTALLQPIQLNKHNLAQTTEPLSAATIASPHSLSMTQSWGNIHHYRPLHGLPIVINCRALLQLGSIWGSHFLNSLCRIRVNYLFQKNIFLFTRHLSYSTLIIQYDFN